MNLTSVKKLQQHDDLCQLLERVRNNGHKALITIHHDTEERHSVLERVKKDGEHHWWETLLGWSPAATQHKPAWACRDGAASETPRSRRARRAQQRYAARPRAEQKLGVFLKKAALRGAQSRSPKRPLAEGQRAPHGNRRSVPFSPQMAAVSGAPDVLPPGPAARAAAGRPGSCPAL
ncbi:uncharacterized protein LJ206_015028 [Theristicus caerulescens]